MVARGGNGSYDGGDYPAGGRGYGDTSYYDSAVGFGLHAALYGDGTTQGGGSTEPQVGAIEFSNLQWDDTKTTASVTVSKTTSDTLELQYKVNDDEWKTVDSGYKITNLKDGDVVTACLYDGTTRGYYATLNVQVPDITAPTIEISAEITEPDTSNSTEPTLPSGASKISGTDLSTGLVMKDSKNNEWVWVEVPKTIYITAQSDTDYDAIYNDMKLYTTTGTKKINAKVSITDDKSGVSISKCKYVINTSSYNLGTSEENYTGGTFINTEQTIEYMPTKEGTYYLHALVTDNAGNVDEKILEIGTIEHEFSDDRYEDTYVIGNGNFADETEYNNEKNRMLKSVYDNGGFWISRYEIGTFDAAESVARNTTNVTTPVSQQNAYPIVNKSQPQSQQIVRKMNSQANLLFGVQWDLTLRFLQEKGGLSVSEITNDSTSWGNYNSASFTINRGQYQTSWSSISWINATNVSKPSNNSWKLTTGAADRNRKMNIYDLAGNVWEWTLEGYKVSSSDPSVVINRGGNEINYGDYNSAGSRGTDYAVRYDDYIGLRAALY